MEKRTKIWLWISAVISFIVGLLLLLTGTGLGALFVILGIISLAALTQPGQKLVESKPRLVMWLVFGAFILLVVIVILLGVVALR